TGGSRSPRQPGSQASRREAQLLESDHARGGPARALAEIDSACAEVAHSESGFAEPCEKIRVDLRIRRDRRARVTVVRDDESRAPDDAEAPPLEERDRGDTFEIARLERMRDRPRAARGAAAPEVGQRGGIAADPVSHRL